MEIDDLAVTLDVCRSFAVGPEWIELAQTIRRLESEPEYVLGLTIQLPSDPVRVTQNNLPIPEFDETGFFGRKKELARIKKALLGPYPVVSVLGDGGIGKTAIALRAAYDLIDDSRADYDAVVWVSAKSTVLTGAEIQTISGAIQSSLGLFESAVNEIGGTSSPENATTELLGYLENFKILLILDNLETVTDQRLRDFLLDLPLGSKVLITSRIGLGIENPVKLGPLDEDDSLRLLRALASIRDVALLRSMGDGGLKNLVARMNGHPLFIRWLVTGVQAGKRPAELVSGNGILLDFCMSNVYDKLDADARQVLGAMQAVRGSRAQGEIAFLCNLGARRVQAALLQLMTTNFVIMKRSVVEDLDGVYEVGDFALQYLAKNHSIDARTRGLFSERSQQLLDLGHQMRADGARNRYYWATIDVRGAHDVPAARFLVEALRALERGNPDEALTACAEAQTLAPTYHEAWRVEGIAHEARHDILSAQQAFEVSFDLAPQSAVAAYHFGTFLQRIGDQTRALQLLQTAAKYDNTARIRHEIATAHFSIGRYLEVVDICSTLLHEARSERHVNVDLLLALRAAVFGAEQAKFDGRLADALVLIEAGYECFRTARIEWLSAAHSDLMVRLRDLAAVIVSLGGGDTYIDSKSTELSSKVIDRLRIVDVALLGRETSVVANFDSDRGFGFISSLPQDRFFHKSDLIDRADWEVVDQNVIVAFDSDDKDGRGPRARRVRMLV
ncbi:NB-ARC domain-containing protein [Curtobacterium sp. A7_M15]|uniref:NB-ARC domain-containing protein n=1 Tax=Curtobacterium sp. A7_M15 TaxID=3065241 RepID=UPI0027379519|nr:NB-ARC domain-containing protein [Curtobacterium sp. A7_M15]MDP4332872.1 NB-ARC domain-containing protein [Curtobacterium sp. A7_M15]